MTLDQGLEAILDQQAVLFAGAGFSLGAVSMSGKLVPGARKLTEILCDSISHPLLTSLEEASELVLDERGPDFLAGILTEHYRVRTVAPWQRQICDAPWRRIYTTNYDNIVERSISATPVTLEDDVYDVPKQELLCVHLNGYIDRVTRTNITTHLKLTESSYASASIADSPWCALLREDFRLARAVFLVGYSLSDLDLRRILLEEPELIPKCFFIVGHDPNEILRRRIRKYGQLVDITTEEFNGLLQLKASTYVPADSPTYFTGIRAYQPSSGSDRITDLSFQRLLTDGQWRQEEVQESLRSGQTYYLQRDCLKFIFQLLENNHTIALTSNIGNGKTLLLEGVKYEATAQGFRVFEAVEQTSGVAAELERIASAGGSILVVIDNYEGWLSSLKHFRAMAGPGMKLVVAARNSVHDVLEDDLADSVGMDYVPEVNIDLLSDYEVSWIIDAMDAHGLWGERASASGVKKREFIREKCGSQLSSVLLRLVKSPDIENRFRKLLNKASADREVLDLVLTVLILTVIQGTVRIATLADLIDLRVLNSSSIRKSPVVAEILDFQNSVVVLRSPTTAQYILKYLADPDRVLACLVAITRRAHDAAAVSRQNDALWKKITRFGSLDLVLPEKSVGLTVIRFYESVKNLKLARDNPLFWLQYAVASLTTGQTARAKTYFETAYSYAESRGFDTFQIDNHYARFLLVEAQENASIDAAFSAFREARQIINRQLQSERRHYPFRVAIEYQKLLDRFGSQLSNLQLRELETAAQTVLGYVDGLPHRLRYHRHVRNCIAAMKYIIGRVHLLADE
jgi:hypothetical protein